VGKLCLIRADGYTLGWATPTEQLVLPPNKKNYFFKDPGHLYVTSMKASKRRGFADWPFTNETTVMLTADGKTKIECIQDACDELAKKSCKGIWLSHEILFPKVSPDDE
jgi:hypothetical protein